MRVNTFRSSYRKGSAVRAMLTSLAIGAFITAAHAQDEAEQDGNTFDGLVAVEDAPVAVAYIDPEFDFSVFQRVYILDPHVAFQANWLRDQNRTRRGTNRVSNRDVERIQRDVASLFKDVFTDVLEEGGYEIAEGANADVLVLRPAIIDLDVSAPDTRSAGRSRTFTASAGAATLYIELFDSLSSQIVGRAADRQVARRAGGTLTWSNSVTNSQEARRMMRGWAETLRDFLDSHYKG